MNRKTTGIKFNIICLILSAIFSGGAFVAKAQQRVAPADKSASAETSMLYQNMLRLMDKGGVMYGHHEDLAYGVGWEYERKRSDVKSVTGSYPAVYGWDMGRLELDSVRNIDGVPFEDMVGYMQDVYKRGGINTISWHMNDPVTGATSWSTPKNSVQLILDSAKYQAIYNGYLDRFAAFVNQLKTKDDKLIPVIFRPFHELTGNWFWWGKTECTPKEFIAFWRYTVNYLTVTKQLHNLLFAYSTADFYSDTNYLERYPGDDYVDIMGFDAYCDKAPETYGPYLRSRLDILSNAALQRLKIMAITEFGYNMIPDPTWWTKTMLPVVSEYRLSYMMSWRNWKEDHYFSPYPGQVSADDFKSFYKDPVTLFQDDLPSSIYKKLIR